MASQTPTRQLFIQIGSRRYPVETLQRASEMFCTARDASGFGASDIPSAHIVDDVGKEVASISYNGRVWPAGEWFDGMKPLYDNRAAA